jgi:hypothetical protein
MMEQRVEFVVVIFPHRILTRSTSCDHRDCRDFV